MINEGLHFLRVQHGQRVEIRIQKNHEFSGVIEPVSDGMEQTLGVGKKHYDHSPYHTFVVEFVEKTPEIKIMDKSEDGMVPDRIMLRSYDKASLSKQYIRFGAQGKVTLSAFTGITTEMFCHPQPGISGSGFSEFKLESAAHPNSFLQGCEKEGSAVSHGADLFGSNTNTFKFNSAFVKKMADAFDSNVSPCPASVSVPKDAKYVHFTELHCVEYKKVMNKSRPTEFDHAAYQFAVRSEEGFEKQVWRRFSVARQFCKDLQKELPHIQFPDLPSKGSMLKSESNDNLLRERQSTFEQWFNIANEHHQEVTKTKAFETFTNSVADLWSMNVILCKENTEAVRKDNGKFSHTVYVLQVSYMNQVWKVHKRFSDIHRFCTSLKSEFKDVNGDVSQLLSGFPPKQTPLIGKSYRITLKIGKLLGGIDHENSDFVEKRASELATWFDKATDSKIIGRSLLWKKFWVN